MSTNGRPSNVTGCEVPGSTALTPACPPAGRATYPDVMGRSAPPNALEKRSRTCCPPTDVWIVCRTVLSASTRLSWVNGAGGMLPGSVSCGIETQLSTQCHAAPDPGSPPELAIIGPA